MGLHWEPDRPSLFAQTGKQCLERRDRSTRRCHVHADRGKPAIRVAKIVLHIDHYVGSPCQVDPQILRSGDEIDDRRPGLQHLMADIATGKVDILVDCKIDRLTRSLPDFARMVELFDKHEVSFVSVTQSLNTTSSMGRLTLNVLLSFAQFEREVTGERIRDKIAASKAKGMWMGGMLPLGYDLPKDKSALWS